MQPATPVAAVGADTLITLGPVTVIDGSAPVSVIGPDAGRRYLQVDNEGLVDLFVSEDDAGNKLTHGGGVRVPAGTSRPFAVKCALLIYTAGAGNGLFRVQIETDSSRNR